MGRLRALAAGIALALAPEAAIAQTAGSATAERAAPAAQDAPAARVLRFRHVEPRMKLSVAETPAFVRFVVDDAFPPWSWREGDALKGVAVDVADALCRELKIKCAFIVRPFEDASAALASGAADAALSGVAVTTETAETFDFTRPWLFSVGRFVERKGARRETERFDPFTAQSPVAVAKGSAHEAWLRQTFPDNPLTAYATDAQALQAVKDGVAETAFVDAMRGAFWIASPAARDCCALAGSGYVAPAWFSRPVTIAVRKGDARLLNALDYGLDRLDQSGATGAILNRYVPGGVM